MKAVSDELRDAVDAGDWRRALELAIPLTGEVRRAARTWAVAVAHPDQQGAADREPGARRRRSAAAAVVAATVEPARASRDFWGIELDDDDLYELLARLRPTWLETWIKAWMRLAWESGRPFLLARRLERAGVVVLERDESWDVGFMGLGAVADATVALGVLLDDPQLLAEVPRLFAFEGAANVSMSNCSAYGRPGWDATLRLLVDEGHLRRDDVLDLCLGALVRGFGSGRAAWYRHFLASLGPSPTELAARLEGVVPLLSSGDGPTVGLGLELLGTIDPIRPVRLDDVASGLAAAVTVKARKPVESALALAARLGGRERRMMEAASATVDALASAEETVQQAWALRFGPDHLEGRVEEIEALLEPWIPVVTPRVRSSLQAQLRRRAGTGPTDIAAEPAPVSFPTAVEGAPRRALPAPLDADRILTPLRDAESVRAALALALEAPGDVDRAELALAGAATIPCDDPAAAEALARRAREVLVREDVFATSDLALVAHAWATRTWPARRFVLFDRPTLDGAPFASVYQLRARSLAWQLVQGVAAPLLSTPTHRGGWIDPSVIRGRLAARDEAEVYCPADLALALARVAPDPTGEARAVLGGDGLGPGLFRAVLGDRVTLELYDRDLADIVRARLGGPCSLQGWLERAQETGWDLATTETGPRRRARRRPPPAPWGLAARVQEPWPWPLCHGDTSELRPLRPLPPWLVAAWPSDLEVLALQGLQSGAQPEMLDALVAAPGPIGPEGARLIAFGLGHPYAAVRHAATAALVSADGRVDASVVGAAIARADEIPRQRRDLGIDDRPVLGRIAACLASVADLGHAGFARDVALAALGRSDGDVPRDFAKLVTTARRLVDRTGPAALSVEARAALREVRGVAAADARSLLDGAI